MERDPRLVRRCGRLIVFEGVDGAGKTTLATALHQHLVGKGIDCLLASFPGREPRTLGSHVYRLYHNPERFRIRAITPTAVQVLVTAAHVDVIQSRILPALHRGRSVILDRYWWSTWVYARQAQVAEPVLSEILRLENLVFEGVKPAAVLLITRSRRFPKTEHGRGARATLARLYRQLARSQRNEYPVYVVRNDGTVDSTLKLILKKLGDLEDHRPEVVQHRANRFKR